MCIEGFAQQRTVADHPFVVNSDLSLVPLTNCSCETTIIRRSSSVLGITIFTKLSFPHQFLGKLLCTAAILHTRRVPFERSVRSMYHLFSYDAVKLRIFIRIWKLCTDALINRICSDPLSEPKWIWACGRPRFCHSIEYMWQTVFPKTAPFVSKSINLTIFCLNTLAMMSCLSCGVCPGSKEVVISDQSGLQVNVINRSGLP